MLFHTITMNGRAELRLDTGSMNIESRDIRIASSGMDFGILSHAFLPQNRGLSTRGTTELFDNTRDGTDGKRNGRGFKYLNKKRDKAPTFVQYLL